MDNVSRVPITTPMSLRERARPGLGIIDCLASPAEAPHLAKNPNRFGISDRHER
jgi:hypothetical protein